MSRTGPLRRSRWTLRRTLVTGITVMMGTLILIFGVLSIVNLRSTLTQMVDDHLSASISALDHSTEKFLYPDSDPDSAGRNPAGTKPLVDFTGQGPGTMIALLRDGTVVDSALFADDGSATTLGSIARTEVAVAVTHPIAPTTVHLASLGSYRVTATENSHGDLLIAAVSLASTEDSVMRETLLITILAIIAIAVTVAGTLLIVRFALQPLGRVAATAVEVTSIPLDKGEVDITARVPAEDTDSRTEVGTVGEALNLLLGHVSDAISVREATDKRMRRFVTDASHELRTPLAAIQGYAELTRQGNESLPDLVEHSLGRIESEAARMSSLVSDLLLLARLDEGQDLQLGTVDLSRLVVDAVSDAHVTHPSHRWIMDVPEAASTVLGDGERLHQLVSNLLRNASVHTPAGSTITTRLRAESDRETGASVAVLTVEDNGPGIPDDVLPVLFERFARGDRSRSRRAGSTGLGLAIVAAIVESHHGRTTVTSSSAGASFRVTLPMLAEVAGTSD